MTVAMPPLSRNQRLPTAGDTPAATPASRSKHRWRSLSRTAADVRAVPPAGDPVSASADAPHDRTVGVCWLASRLLAVEMLLRPIEFAQYTSEAYTRVLESHGIRSSLSRPGNCWDMPSPRASSRRSSSTCCTGTRGRRARPPRARSSSTSRSSTTASAGTRPSATSVRQTTNPATLLCARAKKGVRQSGARPSDAHTQRGSVVWGGLLLS